MSQGNAKFDAMDFEEDFSPDFGDFDASTPATGFDDPFAGGPSQATGGFDEAFSSNDISSGDLSVPRISIHAFCEKESTASLIQTAAADRRLSKATVTVDRGGMAGATEFFSERPTPNLLIVESLAPAAQLLRELDRLAEHCDPNVKVVLVGATNDIALYRQLVSRGVSEYLVPPFQPVQLIRSISGLFVDPDKPFVGKSVAVVGAKGGVGASTIAHNLSWSISENIQINTSLVDLDLSFGTTGLDFNHESAQSIADALLAPERVDDTVIERLLSRASDRLTLFTAPASLNQTFEVEVEAYETVIEHVRRTVPFVVLDLPHVWSDWSRNVLINADEVVIVSGPDLASLRNGKNIVDFLTSARPHDAKPKLVINMVGVPKRPEIPVKDFAAAMGVEPTLVLPFEPQLFGTASNNGQMLSEAAPESRSAQGIDHLAATLTGRELAPVETGFLSKLMSRKK